MMIFYKAVTHTNGKLYSWNAHPSNRYYSIEYKINEWVFPKYKYCPLMVFDSLVNLKRFIPSHSNINGVTEIYSCEIIKSKKKWSLFVYSKIEELIRRKKQKKSINHLRGYFWSLPYGTVLADSVKLLERIKND